MCCGIPKVGWTSVLSIISSSTCSQCKLQVLSTFMLCVLLGIRILFGQNLTLAERTNSHCGLCKSWSWSLLWSPAQPKSIKLGWQMRSTRVWERCWDYGLFGKMEVVGLTAQKKSEHQQPPPSPERQEHLTVSSGKDMTQWIKASGQDMSPCGLFLCKNFASEIWRKWRGREKWI